MAIASTDLVAYCAASRPTDDSSLGGGAIDATVRPTFTQLSTASGVEMVSDGADTRTCTLVYADAAGVRQTTSAIALNGTTPVTLVAAAGATAVLRATLSAGSGTRTVTIRIISGGATIATIPINEVGFAIQFDNCASESSQSVRYDKIFWKNCHGTLSLQNAQVTLTADPSSRLYIGLAAAVDDTATITNRKTAPAGISFSDDNVALNVPGTNLAAGHAIGVWPRLTLPANDPAANTSFTTQLSGQTAA